ncbi:MAG: glycosyltransferase family 4 protein [Candidatus Acidiferrales bacterium]
MKAISDGAELSSNSGSVRGPVHTPEIRVAVVSPFLDKRHGTERAMIECISRLNEDFEFHVYSNRVEDLDFGRVVWHKVPALPGPHLFSYLWWFFANRVWRWRDRRFRGLASDIVFSPGVNCLDADAVVVHIVFREFYRLTRDELRLSRIPVWSWPRAIHRKLYYRLIMVLERRVYSNPQVRLAAVSRFTAEQLRSCFGRTDVAVIPNAVDHGVFHSAARLERRAAERAKYSFSVGDFVLLLIGNDWKKKGLRFLLEAASLCGDPSLRILVVGSDDERPYRNLAQTLGVAGQIRFVPPAADPMQFYAACDAYVGPSLEDAFGLPTAEAMACGLPVITSRQAGVSEIVTHGADGFILEVPSDTRMLAALIRRLIEDPGLCQRIGESAVRATQALSWDNNAAALRDFLGQALLGAQARRNRPARA